MKILAFKGDEDMLFELKPYEHTDTGIEFLPDRDEDGELFSVFTPAELSFPNGEIDMRALEKELELKSHMLCVPPPYKPAVNHACPAIILPCLEQLGFSFTMPHEFLDELEDSLDNTACY